MNFESFEKSANQFFEHLQSKMQGIDLQPNWSIDHLCYRVKTQKEYLAKKSQFEVFSTLLIESEVNGRPISTFKLKRPLRFFNRQIDLLELPAPKPGKTTIEGFEHIEIVCDFSFKEIANRYTNFTFNDNGLKKDFNAELQIELDEFAIKFHHLSLESVVTLEKNEPVMTALRKSKILSELKEFSPLIAGTFPLGIYTDNSDIDILLTSADLEGLTPLLKSRLGHLPKFECSHKKNDGQDYVLARFVLAGVPFEIYAEQTDTIQQRAYKHFQVEERLLKLGGSALKDKILDLRAKGIKTEPAFGEVLKLGPDPYLKLLEMHTWPEEKLAQIVSARMQIY